MYSRELGAWFNYTGNKQFPKNQLNWHHEIQYRNYDFDFKLEQLLIRTGIGYNLNEGKYNVLLGYGYILSNTPPGNIPELSINEHRIFQQFTTKQQLSRLYLSHRYRFEQRFIEQLFKMRARYFLAATVPLNKKTIDANTLYLSSYAEVFLNLDEDPFDRVRLYGGLGYKFSKLFRAELAYMNQVFNGTGRDQLNLNIFTKF